MSIPLDESSTKPASPSGDHDAQQKDDARAEPKNDPQAKPLRVKPHPYRIRPLGRFLAPWTKH